MKVLRIINSLEIGGAERSIVSNIEYHINNGIEMEVMLLNGVDSIFLDELKKTDVKIHTLGKDNNIYNPKYIYRISRVINKYDIIHGHLFPVLYWLGLAKLFSFSKTKLVYTEHSTHNRRRDYWFTRKIDEIIYKQYDVIISISEATDISIKKMLKNKVKTVVISNGVDLLRIKSESEMQKPSVFNSYKEKRIILMVAGFRPEKDHKTVIKSLLYLPQEYVVFFIGEGEKREECEIFCKELNLDKRVEFLGLKNNIGVFIKNSDIAVLSSFWEGFGRAAVEGMSLGLPTIGSNVTGLKDVIKDKRLIFEQGNEKQLAQLIFKITNNLNLYKELSKKCKLRAQKFDVKNMVEQYEKVYYSLLK